MVAVNMQIFYKPSIPNDSVNRTSLPIFYGSSHSKEAKCEKNTNIKGSRSKRLKRVNKMAGEVK